LEVAVAGLVVANTDFDRLVGDLDHLEVVLHFLLEQGVVEDGYALRIDGSHDVGIAPPLGVDHWTSLGLDGGLSLPAIGGVWT